VSVHVCTCACLRSCVCIDVCMNERRPPPLHPPFIPLPPLGIFSASHQNLFAYSPPPPPTNFLKFSDSALFVSPSLFLYRNRNFCQLAQPFHKMYTLCVCVCACVRVRVHVRVHVHVRVRARVRVRVRMRAYVCIYACDTRIYELSRIHSSLSYAKHNIVPGNSSPPAPKMPHEIHTRPRNQPDIPALFRSQQRCETSAPNSSSRSCSTSRRRRIWRRSQGGGGRSSRSSNCV